MYTLKTLLALCAVVIASSCTTVIELKTHRVIEMPCYKPLKGWRSDVPNPKTGKYPVLFTPSKTKDLAEITVPCGQCIGCRLDRSRTWALRIMHETSLHRDSSFITLTYNDENMPADQSLNKKDWQDFLKRFRDKFPPKTIRFFMCGEYGDNPENPFKKFGRPHFHAIIFGWFPDKDDREQVTKTSKGHPLYRSKLLDRTWRHGHAWVGRATFESAAYVARYVTKKINGPMAEDHYKDVHLQNLEGALIDLEPEFCLSSRRPAIGKQWFHRYKEDLHKGYITYNGNRLPIPKYYDKLIEKEDPELLDHLKMIRERKAAELNHDNTDERLQVKEAVKHLRIKSLKREL